MARRHFPALPDSVQALVIAGLDREISAHERRIRRLGGDLEALAVAQNDLGWVRRLRDRFAAERRAHDEETQHTEARLTR